MRYIADLHLHSKYSRACSKNLDLEGNTAAALLKGINIVGTGDFTHPAWIKELEEKLVEERPGLFKLKNTNGKVLFMLTTEVSCIYSQGGKTRRIHLCIFAPDIKAVKKIIASLEKRNVNLRSDGRPIMGLSAEEVAKIVFGADERCMVIPAHAWTPWFSVFGSKSGFDSLEECFGSMTENIYAIETGLSSDPTMNWRLSMLDHLALISNSDAHSPANLGREANVFDINPADLSYDEICRIIRQKDKEKFLYTVEFFPEEGKYYWDGHRDCNMQMSPVQSKKNKNLCPKCSKKITIGVENRVNELADRSPGDKPSHVIPFKSLVPLQEIIAEVVGMGIKTKTVASYYDPLIEQGGSEFGVLLDVSESDLKNMTKPEIVQAIMNVRKGKVKVSPGYDGVYGTVSVGVSLRQ